MKFLLTLAALALLACPRNVKTDDGVDLAPGKSAPAWKINEWIKGDVVERLDPQGTYVIEFWATWCGPCIEFIPKLTELAKKHPDVTVIGISIDADAASTRQFVEDMGDKMAYRVAHAGDQGAMVDSWLKAAGQDGIPSTFIVHRGQLVWIGPPGNLEKRISEIKNETFDLEASKKSFAIALKESQKNAEINSAFQSFEQLRDGGKKADAASALAALVEKYPETTSQAEFARYQWLAEDDAAAWLAKTKSLLASGQADQRQQVTSFALRSAKKPNGTEQARMAIELVLHGDGVNQWDVLIYARAIYTELGDDRQLLRIVTKMLEIYPNSPAKDNAGFKSNLSATKMELEAKLGGKQ